MVNPKAYSRARHWWLALLVCCLFMARAFAAPELTASVDRDHISIEETFTLDVKLNEQVTFGSPDFEPLADSFDVLSTSRNNQYQSINGQVESWTQWRLTLAPRRSGKLTIPALSFKGASTRPIPIEVDEPSDQPLANAEQPVYIETSVDKNHAYVQEQLLLTQRLMTSVNLTSVKSEDLTVDGAQVKQVSQQQFQKRINGRQYAVIEVTYAIFPERSGKLVIPAVNWNVGVDDGRADPIFGHDPFFRQGGKILRLRTREQRIDVNPQPAGFDGRDWLPATQVSLLQSWSGDPSSFRVGEPLTRTITLQADGLTSAQLPPLPLEETDGLKYYPDQPQQNDTVSSDGVSATRTESYAIVPTRAGTFTLPAMTVSWWDTNTDSLRKATLPPQQIKVGAAAGGAPAAPQTTANTSALIPDPEATDSAAASSQASPGENPADAETGSRRYLWPAICAVLLLSNLVTLLLWLSGRQYRGNNSTSAQLPEHQTAASASSERELLRQLKDAARQNQPLLVRAALIDWARSHWPDNPPANLQDIISLTPSPALQAAIKALDSALFNPQASADSEAGWSATDLLQAVEAEPAASHHKPAQAQGLGELYPS